MQHKVKLSQFPTGSILKFGLFANLGVWIPFGILVGGLGFFGFDTVKWSGQPVHGGSALIIGPMISVFIAFIGALLFMVGTLALRIIPNLTGKIEFNLKAVNNNESPQNMTEGA